nr:sigma-70 family RNA polymerase sigma factor [Alistipes shahii]
MAETAEQVEIIVGKMPPQRQQIFRMSRFEHMPSREIAEQLNLSVRTVDKHLELALKELRKYLNIIPAIIVFLDILP